MAPRKKSKAKKPTETMRQRQMRLRREALARKAASRKALPPGKKGGPLAKTTKALPAGKTPKALPPGKKGGGLSRAVRGVKGVGPNAAVGRLAGRALVPLGMAAEVKAIDDRRKRDAERNRRLGRRPFEELRADNYKGNSGRRGQGSRPRKPGSKPKADPKAVARLTQPGGLFYRGPKNGSKPKPKPAAKPAAKPASKPKPKPAAKPAAKKPAPKKPTKKVSGVGPVKSGRSYSVQKTGKSVMQQQAAELRKMREASKKRQAADKAKLKKSQSKKKKR